MAAHALDPNSAETGTNIGSALPSLGRCDEALRWFDKALEIRPNLAEELHRFDDAFALYNRMKARKLNNTRTEWILSHLRLLTGNFEAGWAGQEARLKLPSATYPKFPLPIWLGGENIEGKTILICADEGLGDTIQFVRYVPMLVERGARVVLVVQNPLYHHLLSELPGILLYFSFKAAVAGDRHARPNGQPAAGLPNASRYDSVGDVVSVFPCQEPCANLGGSPGPHTRLRVGLVWCGSPTDTNDHNRSIPLRTLSRILDVDATFVSLQKDPRPSDATVLRERNGTIDLTADLIDFSETAALVSCLDLVITVDTSVAHLAGALGCPTWILLPYRWLLDRDDSPWYPSVRLFRRDQVREYASVLDRVREALRAIAFRRDGAYAPPCHENLVMQQD
jgi:hypothetical protein